MTTFGIMATNISDELGRNDLLTSTLNPTVSPVANAIQRAIKYYESERLFFNEARAVSTTTAPVSNVGTPNYALPSNLIELDNIEVTVNSKRYDLDVKPWDTINALIGVSASFDRPRLYALYQQQFWLYPVPDAAYVLTVSYLKTLSTLSVSGDTNAWMVEGEALIRTRAKVLLLLETIKAPEQAAPLEALEQDLLTRLRARTGRIVGTGHVQATQF